MSKIKNFFDLEVWKEAHSLVLEIYKITKTFPKEELFGIIMQMRRSVVSITSNIAEGFSRKSYKEKIQFYYAAVGSLTELQNQLMIVRDVGYIRKDVFVTVYDRTVTVHKILNGLIKKSKSYT